MSELNNITPSNALSFQCINLATHKSNELYAGGHSVETEGNSIVLEIKANETTTLWGDSDGNPNPQHFTLVLIFQEGILDKDNLKDVRLRGDQAQSWKLKAFPELNAIYLLANTPKEITTRKKLDLHLYGLMVTNRGARVGNMELAYRTSPKVEKKCAQIPIALLSHSGIRDSPFRLLLETPVHPVIRTDRWWKLRLLNDTSDTLNLSKTGFYLSFDLYENKLKSNAALTHEGDFDSDKFRVSISRPDGTTVGVLKKESIGSRPYKGIMTFNLDGQWTKLYSLAPGQCLTFDWQTNGFDRIAISPIHLSYFNIPGYWDGKLTTALQFSHFSENSNGPFIYGKKVHFRPSSSVGSNEPQEFDIGSNRSLKVNGGANFDGVVKAKGFQETFGEDQVRPLIPEGAIMLSETQPKSGWEVNNGISGKYPVSKAVASEEGDGGDTGQFPVYFLNRTDTKAEDESIRRND